MVVITILITHRLRLAENRQEKYLFCNHSNRELLMNTLYVYEIGLVPIAVFLVLKLPCY